MSTSRSPYEAVWADPRLGATVGEDEFVLNLAGPEPRLLPDQPTLLAGVAVVDITPPPGMPKAGHSKNAHDGNGFRTRLRARIVHLRQGRSSVVLIALDLLAGSAVVQHAVARLIADTDVPLSGVFLAATHTHAGPGQYSGSRFYNDWASNRPGFDPGYAGFLVTRLAEGIRDAVAGRRPARAAFGVTDVWGLTRNRSHGAFVRNEDVPDKRSDPQRPYTAIDPRLHLLRVDDTDGPLGAFTWFSIHGTGISHHDSSYNADVWAYLNGELEQRVQGATGRRPLSAAAVASHGDMTPAVTPGMLVFPEAERIGRGLGAAAADLHATLGAQLSADFAVAATLHEIDLRAHPDAGGLRLESPRIGWAKAAGAAENTTPVLHRIPPFKAGLGRSRPRGPHGAKRIAATEWGHARFVGRPADFPEIIGFHLLRLGPASVLGLPFETCVEAGRRVAGALGSAGPALVSSLVNDQCDYLTTREEYGAQHYEGASTLFGAQQQEWVAASAAGVAAALEAGTPDVGGGREFRFGVHRYLPIPAGGSVTRSWRPAGFVEASGAERPRWEAEYTDALPGDLHWHEPLLAVQRETSSGWETVTDDQGWSLGIVHLKGTRYRASWYGPPLGRPGRHRFVLLENAGQPAEPGPAFD